MKGHLLPTLFQVRRFRRERTSLHLRKRHHNNPVKGCRMPRNGMFDDEHMPIIIQRILWNSDRCLYCVKTSRSRHSIQKMLNGKYTFAEELIMRGFK
jgi:hypothetical protein